MSANNPQLGERIAKLLVSKKVETPFYHRNQNWLNTPEVFECVRKSYEDILKNLNLDVGDDSLQDTPKRIAKMFTKEIFYGLDYYNFPKITCVKNGMGYDEMVIEKGIAVKSVCEHHFVPIDGFATVAYIPSGKVIGLSKMNRVVDFFSRRPQIQERLTEQVYYTLAELLETENVAVLIDSTHFCVRHRGIEHTNSSTTTCKLGGEFKESSSTRSEFMQIAHKV